MRRVVYVVIGLAAVAAVWRRNRRIGVRLVNLVVNPALVRRGLAGGSRSELGMIEHIGRKSGIRRLTPIHPEPTADGFRIVVPLGEECEWAKNVLAAGHCRLQLHERVYELDEPRMAQPDELDAIPSVLRAAEKALGFEYLVLHRFSDAPGSLEAETPAEGPTEPAASEVATRVG